MKTYKLVLLIILGVFAVGGSFFYFLFESTAPATDAGASFLRQIAADGPEAAYASAAPTLRARSSSAAFAEFVTRRGLTEFDRVSWTNRFISSGTNGTSARLAGTATLRSGATVRLQMTLVKQNGAWLVAGLTILDSVPAPDDTNRRDI